MQCWDAKSRNRSLGCSWTAVPRRALTYAELATIWPRAGGEYIFIRNAYSSRLAFLYGWMRFVASGAGSLAALAVGLAIFLNVLLTGASTPPISVWIFRAFKSHLADSDRGPERYRNRDDCELRFGFRRR